MKLLSNVHFDDQDILGAAAKQGSVILKVNSDNLLHSADEKGAAIIVLKDGELTTLVENLIDGASENGIEFDDYSIHSNGDVDLFIKASEILKKNTVNISNATLNEIFSRRGRGNGTSNSQQ